MKRFMMLIIACWIFASSAPAATCTKLQTLSDVSTCGRHSPSESIKCTSPAFRMPVETVNTNLFAVGSSWRFDEEGGGVFLLSIYISYNRDTPLKFSGLTVGNLALRVIVSDPDVSQCHRKLCHVSQAITAVIPLANTKSALVFSDAPTLQQLTAVLNSDKSGQILIGGEYPFHIYACSEWSEFFAAVGRAAKSLSR